MRKFVVGAALACALALAAPAAVHAAPVHYSISFTSLTVPGIPVNPLTGSFDLQFDDALTYVDATAGITLNSFNATLDSPISFSYSPNVGGTLAIGGLETGAAFVSPWPFTNDFVLLISLLNVAPFALFVAYSFDLFQGMVGIHNVAYHTTLTVNEVTPVPLPAAALLFGSALAGFLGFGRLRQRLRRAAPDHA